MSDRRPKRPDRAPYFPCPVCAAKGLVKSSEAMSRTVRLIRYACDAHACGHTWTAHLEYVATVSPSALGTVAAPFLRLPPRPLAGTVPPS